MAFATFSATVPFAPVMGVAVMISSQAFHHLPDPLLTPVISRRLWCLFVRFISLAGTLFRYPPTSAT